MRVVRFETAKPSPQGKGVESALMVGALCLLGAGALSAWTLTRGERPVTRTTSPVAVSVSSTASSRHVTAAMPSRQQSEAPARAPAGSSVQPANRPASAVSTASTPEPVAQTPAASAAVLPTPVAASISNSASSASPSRPAVAAALPGEVRVVAAVPRAAQAGKPVQTAAISAPASLRQVNAVPKLPNTTAGSSSLRRTAAEPSLPLPPNVPVPGSANAAHPTNASRTPLVSAAPVAEGSSASPLAANALAKTVVQDPKVLQVVGDKAFIRINPKQTIVVKKGQTVHGLGMLLDIAPAGASFENQFVPQVSQ